MSSADRQARFSIISFWWTGLGHPVGRLIPPQGPSRPLAWYVRVPDLPAFLRAVAPVLERRLGESLLAGHTGELSLSFYRDGIRLVFERGRMVAAEVWQPSIQIPSQEWGMPSTDPRRAMAMFPGLSFLQLLSGFRSLEELEAAFPDCLVRTHEVRALLTALFPKQVSDVWALALAVADPGTKRPDAARYFLPGRPGRPYWASTTLAADFLLAPGRSIENAANLSASGAMSRLAYAMHYLPTVRAG